MALWSAQELNDIFGCRLPDSIVINGISIDSRRCHKDDLFFALQGENDDGHNFAVSAAQKGCSAVVVSQLVFGIPDSCKQIVVHDTLEALKKLGDYARKRTNAKVIAVTGSVGKTSTKDMLRQILEQFGRTSCAVESYNNHWGVPLSLARMPADTEFGVFEAGMNNPGEIEPLAHLIKPHIAIITAIAPAHIGRMRSETAIALEKSHIFKGLQEDGLAIIPKDTTFYDFLRERATEFGARNIITFGETEESDYELLSYSPIENAQQSLLRTRTPEGEIAYVFSIPGKHQSINTLICFAVTDALDLPRDKVIPLFGSLAPVQGRGVFHQLELPGQRKITLIDDAYNANLVSLSASIKMLANVEPRSTGRRVLVVGEMLELDHEANAHHEQIATLINELPLDVVYFVGGPAAAHGYDAVDLGKQGFFAPRAEDLKPILMALIEDGDVVLVKGSKGTRVSLLVNHLLAQSLSDQKG